MARRWAWASLVVVLAAAAAAALLLRQAGGGVRRAADLNVLLITIDTLRADAVGAYGGTKAETPWIDRLAAGGVRFADAHAQNVITLPSHANILAGIYPLEHGIRDNAGFRFPSEHETLATLLKVRGYRTGAFVSAFPLDSRFGLDRGFDVYDDQYVNVDTRSAFVIEERTASETVERARRWLEAQASGPWLCWVHIYDPHFPYEPPAPFAARYASDPYQGEVAASDAALGPLLEPLLGAGGEGRTLVALTSDHGESLGEHGEATHGIFAYEATLRVPLVLFAPRLFPPRVVRDPVQHVDLLPTILDLLALPLPVVTSGRSLVPLLEGRSLPTGSQYFESLSQAKNRGWAPLYGLRRGKVKYLDLPLPEVYDLETDPGETRNLAASRPLVLEQMHQRLTALRSKDPGWRDAREDAEVRERLQALGYVAASTSTQKERYTEDDDPKRLIQLDAQLQMVIDVYKRGDLPRALALAEGLLERRGDMPVVLSQLATLYREAGRLDAAIAALQKALALDPRDEATVALLGAYLNEAGRPREALAVLEPYAKRPQPDIDVLIAQGVAEAQRGRRREALAAFERARSADPTNAMPLINVATVHLQARDYPRAREALEAALALNPRIARAHNALGVLAAETGRAEEAIARWKRAVELEPEEYDTLYNLGSLLRKMGRPAEARPYLERFAAKAPPRPYAADISKVRGWLARRPDAS